MSRRIAGLERLAQTEVRQDAADYNRCLGKWKDYLPISSFMHETISDLILPIAHNFTLGVRLGSSQSLAESIFSYEGYNFVVAGIETSRNHGSITVPKGNR